MKVLIALSLFIPSVGLCVEPPSFDGDPKYNQAVNSAIKATAITSGMQDMANKFENSLTKSTSDAIERYTPFGSEKFFFVAGAIYSVGAKQEIAKTFRNPIVPSVTNDIYLSASSVKLGFKVGF